MIGKGIPQNFPLNVLAERAIGNSSILRLAVAITAIAAAL
jgi:hypothetical protein